MDTERLEGHEESTAGKRQS